MQTGRTSDFEQTNFEKEHNYIFHAQGKTLAI